MKAFFNSVKLSHKHFDYVSESDKKEISELLKQKRAVIVSIKDKNKFQCSAVLEVTENSIHAREIGGKFPAYIKQIEMVCHAMGRIYQRKFVTFCTSKSSVEKIGIKLGFEFDENSNEYKKDVI